METPAPPAPAPVPPPAATMPPPAAPKGTTGIIIGGLVGAICMLVAALMSVEPILHGRIIDLPFAAALLQVAGLIAFGFAFLGFADVAPSVSGLSKAVGYLSFTGAVVAAVPFLKFLRKVKWAGPVAFVATAGLVAIAALVGVFLFLRLRARIGALGGVAAVLLGLTAAWRGALIAILVTRSGPQLGAAAWGAVAVESAAWIVTALALSLAANKK